MAILRNKKISVGDSKGFSLLTMPCIKYRLFRIPNYASSSQAVLEPSIRDLNYTLVK